MQIWVEKSMPCASCTALEFNVWFYYSPGHSILVAEGFSIVWLMLLLVSARTFVCTMRSGLADGGKEERDIIRPNYETHTTHFVPFDPLDMRERSNCTYINDKPVGDMGGRNISAY